MQTIVHDITSIDNRIGIFAGLGAASVDESKRVESMIRDCKIYAESPIDDCPDEANDQCWTTSKSGIACSVHNIAAHSTGNMELHAKKEMHLPLSEQVKDSVWNGFANYQDIDFYDFKSLTRTGEKNFLIKLNTAASDYIQM